tara:strand:+ start:6665 stop:7066 length:402 start_codon:yes stop_codon:yes gene_type:complete
MIFNAQVILDKKSKKTLTIGPENTVQDAVEIMAKEKISALPVIKDGTVIGIISERDYIRKAAPKRQLPWDILVSDIMTSDVITIPTSETITGCMQIMTNNRIRHLPVMDNNDLVGIISITDVLRVLRSVNFMP